jgi:hypothetical protein
MTESRRMKLAVHVVHMRGKQHSSSVFVGKPERRRQLEVSGRRWDDIINPLNAELNPICPLLALFGAHHILHVSR